MAVTNKAKGDGTKKIGSLVLTLVLTVGIILVVMCGLSVFETREQERILGDVTVYGESMMDFSLEEKLTSYYPWEETEGEEYTVADIEDLPGYELMNYDGELYYVNEYPMGEISFPEKVFYNRVYGQVIWPELRTLYGLMTQDIDAQMEEPLSVESLALRTRDRQVVYYGSADADGMNYAIDSVYISAAAMGSASRRSDAATLREARSRLTDALTKMELEDGNIDDISVDGNDPIYRFYVWLQQLNYIYYSCASELYWFYDSYGFIDYLSESTNYFFVGIEPEIEIFEQGITPEKVRQVLIDTRSGYIYVRDGRLFLAYDMGEIYLRVQFDPESLDIIGYQYVLVDK